jgi:hypothetical protein
VVLAWLDQENKIMKTAVSVLIILLASKCYATDFAPETLEIDISGIEVIAGMLLVACATMWGIRKAFTAFRSRQ